MKPEQTSTRSSENLTRRQKLLRRAAPLALLTAGVVGGGGYAAHELSNDDAKDAKESTFLIEVTTHASATTKIGTSESGWTHGAAHRALESAVYEGATEAFSRMDGDFTITDDEIASIVKELPMYDQAGDVLSKADIADVVPDDGDLLSVEVAVTADSDKHVEYEIIDAHIEDVPNNQQ